jgi:hypothetical protein
MKKRFLFGFLFILLVSCTKTIDFDDEQHSNQVVVNGIIWPGEAFTLYLTQSGSILKDWQTNTPLEGTLDLYEEDRLIHPFPSQRGVFSAPDLSPKAGKSYRIVVTVDGRAVSAETRIPAQAEVISTDTTSLRNTDGSRTIHYQFKLKDGDGEDYYRIIVRNENLVQVSDVGDPARKYYLNETYYQIQSEDPVFKTVYNNSEGAVLNQGPGNDYFIFPDTYFQGKEYTLEFQVSTYYIGSNEYGDPGNPVAGTQKKLIYDRNVVHVQRLSKELYHYLKYLKLYNHFHDNPFAEPVSVYSNVTNGAGIFAGFNDDTRFTYESVSIPYSMDTIQVEENPSYGNQ